MLYRPKFCCHCGEKIERIEWRLWTSRRFCELCETEFKFQDLGPRVAVVIGLAAGLFGLGTYLQSGANNPVISQNSTQGSLPNAKRGFVSDSSITKKPSVSDEATGNLPSDAQTNTSQELTRVSEPAGSSLSGRNESQKASEAVYFCGAATKKGTPCSRRVKDKGRCWQHAGQPSMLDTEKSRAGR